MHQHLGSLLVAVALLAAWGEARCDPALYLLEDASSSADFSRLPQFESSDPAWDAFVNEYFLRHLSVDARGVYWQTHIAPGAVDQLWTLEGDAWFLPWIDRGAMGLERQRGGNLDVIRTTLARIPVDKYGYVFGSVPIPEPTDSLGGYRPLFGWPWPKYNWNRTTDRPTGWEFNDLADGARDSWAASDLALEEGYPDHCLAGAISGPLPALTSPAFDCDVLQVPIVEIDVSLGGLDGRDPFDIVRGLRLQWTSDDSPAFDDAKCVGPEFSVLPPDDYRWCYQPPYVASDPARFALYFPMYLHEAWGRSGRRITQLRLGLPGLGNEGVRVAVNYVRATYDVRLSTSNADLIRCTAAFALWSGDRGFLATMMPNLRRSMAFMLEHFGGRKEALLCFDWVVGHDGLGGPEPGHGLIGSYWDLLPAGRYDLESSVMFREALKAMATLEEVVGREGIAVPAVSVLGPDSRTRLGYRETPESLRALAERCKARIEREFWVRKTGRFCRNIDSLGRKHDYGFLHFNVLALACGIGTPEQRDSILSWLDGRVIPGDTSTGSDIYHWRFAPRTSTKRNETYYFWPWVEGMRENLPIHQFGNQMQDGGAVPWTSLFELVARAQSGSQEQVDRAFRRTQEIAAWFADVKAAGGEGTEFYRTYYNGHPERGLQQGGGPPGGLGLDREFLSDSAMGTIFVPFAFLGLAVEEDGVLTVSPALPSALDRLAVSNVFFRGNHLRIEAGRDYVSLGGGLLPHTEGLRARILFRHTPPGATAWIGGERVRSCTRRADGTLVVDVPLGSVRVEVR